MRRLRGDQAFSDENLDRSITQGGLSGQLRRALGWTMVGHWGSFVLQLATTMVLARLLSPEDYGLVGMVLTLTVILDQVRTMGLSQAVVQRERLTVDQVNVLFYVNALAGFALAGLVALSAPLVSAFYGRSELVGITLALSLTYALSGLGVQAGALLARQLNFRALALRQTLSRLLASLVAIGAAALGAGYWALVAQQVSLSLFMLVLIWLAVRWRPGRPRGVRATLPLVKFGAGVSLAGLFNAFGRMGDSIIIGRALGATELGVYSRAYTLQQMPLGQLKQPLNGSMTPLLSALQEDPRRYRDLYTGALGGLSMIGLPAAVLLSVTAPETVEVVLGPQWADAAPVLRWLAIAGFAMIMSSSVAWLYASTGRGSAFASWSAAANMVLIASYVVGLRWGVVGVAAAFAVAQLLLAPLALHFAIKGTPVTAHAVVAATSRPFALAVVVLAVAYPVWRIMAVVDSPLVTLVVVSGASVAAWSAAVLAWPSARRQVSTLASVARRPRADVMTGAADGEPAGQR